MESALRAYLEENRRHFDVVAERMESQVRLMAEGVSALGDRLEQMEQNLREEQLPQIADPFLQHRMRMALRLDGRPGVVVHDALALTDGLRTVGQLISVLEQRNAAEPFESCTVGGLLDELRVVQAILQRADQSGEPFSFSVG